MAEIEWCGVKEWNPLLTAPSTCHSPPPLLKTLIFSASDSFWGRLLFSRAPTGAYTTGTLVVSFFQENLRAGASNIARGPPLVL